MNFNIRIIPSNRRVEDSIFVINSVEYYGSKIDVNSDFYTIFKRMIQYATRSKITEIIAQVNLHPKTEKFIKKNISTYLEVKHMMFRFSSENVAVVHKTGCIPAAQIAKETLEVFVLLLLKYGRKFDTSSGYDKSFICVVCGQVQDGNELPAGNMTCHSVNYSSPNYCRYKDCASHEMRLIINPKDIVPEKYFGTAPSTSIGLERLMTEFVLSKKTKV